MSQEVDAAPGRGAADDETGVGGPDELEHLRRLILEAERERLADLERRLGDPDVRAEELSAVLPESLARAARRGNRVGLALAPVLDDAFAASIRKNRKRLAEVLSPLMGPAIRRAIAATLRNVVDSFNQVLQHSLSPRALRWRLEAWRTGRPFAEVVLTHSLLFRVEQVFLVHRQSGLLLQHVAADAALLQDGDVVSGMLTAIQDFVRDSFSVEAEHAVDTMRVGDLAVWVEQAEHAYLAAVIRGAPPVALRDVLRDALEAIHLELGEAFESFSGDSAPFEEARHHLEGCLQMQVAGRSERRRWLVPAVAGGIGLLFLVVWVFLSMRVGRRWDAYLARLGREPGVLVVSESSGLRWSSVSGLLDPQAVDPVRLLAESGLDPARVSSRWEPFVSQHPSMVLARARAALQPPPSVTLAFSAGTLSANGSAPHRWRAAAMERATTIPGVLRFDPARLADEGLAAIRPLQERLAALVLRFDVGSAELPPREAANLVEVVTSLRELAAAARDAGIALRIDIVGHSDGTGPEGANVRLSRARAEWVLSALEARGVQDLALAILGVGASRPLRPEDTIEGRAYNRSVTFHLTAS